MNISVVDLFVILLYFVAIIWITLRVTGGVKDSTDYFLAGRSMRWPTIGASLFASNISAEQFVGQAGLAMVMGMAVANYQMAGVLGFALLGIVFLPVYIRLGIVTTPQYLEVRYGRESRRFASIFQILFLALNAVPLALFAGGQVMRDLFQWDSVVPGVLILAITTGVYAILGGLRAVLLTDFIQMFILVLGGFLVLGFGLHAVGGLEVFLSKLEAYQSAENVDLVSMVRGVDDPYVPWTGVVFGLTVHSLYYCSMNHMIVQRALAAKSIHQGRMGGLFAALLKSGTLLIIILPGLVGFMLLQDGFFSTPPDSPDQMYSTMVRTLLPVGLAGIVLAGLMAALMSSVDSCICAASSLITMDWYLEIKPKASERELVLVGRLAGAFVIVSGIFWAILVIPNFKYLFDYLAKFTSYSVGGVLVCFLGGLISPIPNRKAGFWTLVVGSVAGVAMWIVADNATAANWAESAGLGFLRMHFLHAAAVLTAFSFCVLFGISLLTKESGRAAFLASRSRVLTEMEPTLRENRQFLFWAGIVAAVYCGIYALLW